MATEYKDELFNFSDNILIRNSSLDIKNYRRWSLKNKSHNCKYLKRNKSHHHIYYYSFYVGYTNFRSQETCFDLPGSHAEVWL